MRRLIILFSLGFFSVQAQNVFLTPLKNLSVPTREEISGLSFSNDDKSLAAVDTKGNVFVLSVADGTLIRQINTRHKVLFLRFHSTLSRLFVVTDVGEILYLDGADAGKFAFSAKPRMISIDPTGQYLLALLTDAIEIFDLKASMMANQITLNVPVKKPLYLGYDRFGQQVSLITEGGQVYTWDPLSQKLVRELKLQSGEYAGSRSVIHAAANNYGGDRFVVGMQEVFIPKGGVDQMKNQPERRNMLVFYDWITGQEQKRIPLRYRVDEMAQGPGASGVAYFSKDNNAVWLVNYDKGAIISSIKTIKSPSSLGFSNNNEIFALGDEDGKVTLYNVERNAPAEINIQLPSLDRGYATQRITSSELPVKGIIGGGQRISKVQVNDLQAEYDFNGGFSAKVPLNPGKNKIRVMAQNSEQQTLVKDFYITYEPEQKAASAKHETHGKRVALVIGNSNYAYGNKLINTVNDAKAMSAALQTMGFEVISLLDGDYEKMKNAIYAFGDRISDVDVSLFYYAGHGLEVDGVNYLMPVDANIQSALDVKQKAVALTGVLRTMEFTNDEGLNMIILDACRNNPFPTGKRGGSGLTKIQAPSGTLIAYATDPGATASDGDGKNGLYTGELVRQMLIPQRIEDVFMNTRNRVEEISKGAQRPWEEARLKGVFYLK